MLELPILKTPDGVAIIKFHGKHLRQVEMREPELSWSRWDPEFLDNIERMVDPGASWTAVHRGKVLLSFGIRTMTRHVGEAWLLPSKDINKHSISLVRCARKLFDDLLENKGFCRIQIGVMVDNDIALRCPARHAPSCQGYRIMGFLKPKKPPEPSEKKKEKDPVEKAQDRAEQRAEAAEQQEAQQAAARMRLMQTGGLRLLFSPMRQPGTTQNTLGSSGDSY